MNGVADLGLKVVRLSPPAKKAFPNSGKAFLYIWLFGAVPEKGGFQALGSGFLWSRARKGWFSGTGGRFSMESCPKGVVFRHGTDSILHCRPQVSSQKMDTCRGAEGFSSILSHLNLK